VFRVLVDLFCGRGTDGSESSLSSNTIVSKTSTFLEGAFLAAGLLELFVGFLLTY